MIKVIIADDVILLRNGIKKIIEQDDEIQVVACVGNGKEAVQFCQMHLPEIVLMDIRMPVMNGIEATRAIKEMNSSIKILMLTTFCEDDDITKSIDAGADGYILKDLDEHDLISVIKSTVKGLNIIHSNAFHKIRKKVANTKNVANESEDNGFANICFTDREMDIIRLVIEGKKNKEIGEQLFITEGTVKNVTSRILKKLGLEDRTQLAIYAVKNNLL